MAANGLSAQITGKQIHELLLYEALGESVQVAVDLTEVEGGDPEQSLPAVGQEIVLVGPVGQSILGRVKSILVLVEEVADEGDEEGPEADPVHGVSHGAQGVGDTAGPS